MKLNSKSYSVVLSLVLSLSFAIWLFTGNTYSFSNEEPETTVSSPAPPAIATSVETQLIHAQTYQPTIEVQGQLQPIRETHLISRIQGAVLQRPVELGDIVEKDAILYALDPEDRNSQLRRAQADLKLAEAELSASKRLVNQRLAPETELLRREASVAAANAEIQRIRNDIALTRIRAPFSGRIEQLEAKVGDTVQPGNTLVSLIDNSAVKLMAKIPQLQAQLVSQNLKATARLPNGETLDGSVSFIANMANPNTRSYDIEAIFDNTDDLRIAGSSASLTIQLPEQLAHRFSPALLSLNNQGQTGIHWVDNDSVMRFSTVTILSLDTNGVWVLGLPETVNIITQGAGFAVLNEKVNPYSTSEQ